MPGYTLRQKLVHHKEKPDNNKTCEVIYSIKCVGDNCSASYVGEMKQALISCLKQQKGPAPTKLRNQCFTTTSTLQVPNAKILDGEQNWFDRGVKEAIYERTVTIVEQERGVL